VFARHAEVVDRPVDVPSAGIELAQVGLVALAARRQVDEPPHADVKQSRQTALDELGVRAGQDAAGRGPIGVCRDAGHVALSSGASRTFQSFISAPAAAINAWAPRRLVSSARGGTVVP